MKVKLLLVFIFTFCVSLTKQWESWQCATATEKISTVNFDKCSCLTRNFQGDKQELVCDCPPYTEAELEAQTIRYCTFPGGTGVPYGDTYIINDCLNYTCSNGAFIDPGAPEPIQASECEKDEFTFVPNVGCVKVVGYNDDSSQPVSWCEARRGCQSMNADLATVDEANGETFHALHLYAIAQSYNIFYGYQLFIGYSYLHEDHNWMGTGVSWIQNNSILTHPATVRSTCEGYHDAAIKEYHTEHLYGARFNDKNHYICEKKILSEEEPFQTHIDISI